MKIDLRARRRREARRQAAVSGLDVLMVAAPCEVVPTTIDAELAAGEPCVESLAFGATRVNAFSDMPVSATIRRDVPIPVAVAALRQMAGLLERNGPAIFAIAPEPPIVFLEGGSMVPAPSLVRR